RTRRRRVFLGLVALLAGAAALTFVFRPSPAPAPIRVTFRGSTRGALAHVKVPVDALEREWRAGIKSVTASTRTSNPSLGSITALTSNGVAQLHTKVAALVKETGAAVVRMSVWPRAGAVEAVF